MKNVLLIFALFLSFQATAWADGVVKSDAIVQVSNSLFSSPEFSLSSLLAGHETMMLPDMTINAQVPVNLSGLLVEAAWQLETPTTGLAIGREIPLASKELAVRLMIQKIAVDAWVDQEVGGVIVHAHVLGGCDNIPLVLTGPAKLTGAVRALVDSQGLPGVELVRATAEWADGAWQIGDFNCSLGGQSFRTRVVDGLKSYLAAPSASLNDRLKAAFSSRLTDYQKRLQAWFLEPRHLASGLDGVSLTLRPRKIASVLESGLMIAGQVDFTFASARAATPLTVSGASTTPSPSASCYQLALPAGLPQALGAMAHRLGYFKIRQPGSDIQVFQDFLGNPFFKFFLWPQMMFYSQNDPFYFDFSLFSQPRFGEIANSRTGGVTGQIATDLGALLWAPAQERFVKMLRFTVPLKTVYQWTMSASPGGGSDVSINLSNTQLAVRADWERDYQAQLLNPYIAADVLKDHFASWVEGRNLKFHLPPLKLSTSMELSFAELEREGDWLRFKLADYAGVGRSRTPRP